MERNFRIGRAVLTLTLIGLSLIGGCSAPSTGTADTSAETKAAIIDQLYGLQPNQRFIDDAVEALNAYGLEVDIYQGDEVTVDFYRKLPAYGYKLIIFRAHSGALISNSDLIEATFLFTSEPYSKTEYIGEQLTDQIAVGRITEQHPPCFTIGAKFITKSMQGKFPNTVIVMMGCSALRFGDMAPAFVEKGASTYLGWDASVDLHYVDVAALNLISNLCTEGMTVEQAVVSTMTEVGPAPTYNAWLHYYPDKSGRQTIAELIH